MTTPFHSEASLTGSRQTELSEIATACLNQCVSGKSADSVAHLSDRLWPGAAFQAVYETKGLFSKFPIFGEAFYQYNQFTPMLETWSIPFRSMS
jgi:hypothetical protein